MSTASARQATLDQIAEDIRRCAQWAREAVADRPAQSLADRLWDLSEARKVQLGIAEWDERHGYHASAAEHRARAAALKEQAQGLVEQAEQEG